MKSTQEYKDNIIKALKNNETKGNLSSSAVLIMQMYLHDQPIPDWMKIRFNSAEFSQGPMVDRSTHALSLNQSKCITADLLTYLPYDYWKNHINETILSSQEHIKDALIVAFKTQNISFLSETIFALVKISHNVQAEMKAIESLPQDERPTKPEEYSKLTFTKEVPMIHTTQGGYIHGLNVAATQIYRAWETAFPFLLVSKQNISDEKIEELHMIQKFFFTYFCKNTGGQFVRINFNQAQFQEYKDVQSLDNLKAWYKKHNPTYASISTRVHTDDTSNVYGALTIFKFMASHITQLQFDILAHGMQQDFSKPKYTLDDLPNVRLKSISSHNTNSFAVENTLQYIWDEVLATTSSKAIKPSHIATVIKDSLAIDYFFDTNMTEKMISQVKGTPQQWIDFIHTSFHELEGEATKPSQMSQWTGSSSAAIGFASMVSLRNILLNNPNTASLPIPEICDLFDNNVKEQDLSLSDDTLREYRATCSNAIKMVDNFFTCQKSNNLNIAYLICSELGYFDMNSRRKLSTIFETPYLESPILSASAFRTMPEEEKSALLMNFVLEENNTKTKTLKF